MSGETPEDNENPLFYFVNRPYMYLYKKLFPKTRNNYYDITKNSYCMNEEYLKKYAKSLVQSWMVADAILQKNDIEFFPVLQPNRYTSTSKLDHLPKENLIHKQIFQSAYHIILKEMSKIPLNKKFIPLTSALNDELYYFTDPVHISPNGNLKIAQSLVQRMN